MTLVRFTRRETAFAVATIEKVDDRWIVEAKRKPESDTTPIKITGYPFRADLRACECPGVVCPDVPCRYVDSSDYSDEHAENTCHGWHSSRIKAFANNILRTYET